MRSVKFLLIAFGVAAAFAAGYVLRGSRSSTVPGDGRKVLYWVDPMHPAYRSDKPGIAPDCGMKLEPVYADGGGAIPSRPLARKFLYYADPAQPDYHSDKPGLNPETGNELQPVYERAPAALPANAVRIPTERQQLIGVRFATVELEGGRRDVRTVGQVSFDETRIAHVHTRFEGWIDRVLVNFTGDLVRKGEPMVTVYSPEMLASQQELLLAARARDVMRDNPLRSAAEHGDSLFEAAKRRLQLWDLSDQQIAQVLETGTAVRTVTVVSPISGFVTERNAFPNQKVTPDSDLYTIVDLSRVWVLADVFQDDIGAVNIGGTARVTMPSSDQAVLTARVAYIQPQVDPTTRAMKVRLDVVNPGMRLKPNMYVNVDFSIAQPARLTVPSEAVLDTGGRQVVFVDRGQGYLEPRSVTVGERVGDRVSVTQGLSAGERVVASGTFLVDSESRLQSAAATMGAPGHETHPAPAPAAASPAGRRPPPDDSNATAPAPRRQPPASGQ
jgi:membrane fusion protein, copper/silver efflux system